jgi:hypothetical protein
VNVHVSDLHNLCRRGAEDGCGSPGYGELGVRHPGLRDATSIAFRVFVGRDTKKLQPL